MSSSNPETLPSRSSFMRTDVGPIVTHLAKRLYDEALPFFRPSGVMTNAPALYLADVEPITNRMLQLIDPDSVFPEDRAPAVFSPTTEALPYAQVELDRGRNTMLTPRRIVAKPTHYRDIKHVLFEGVRSGVVMPMATYIAHKMVHLDHDWNDMTVVPFQPEDAAASVRSLDFKAAVTAASHAPNGFYGSDSSSGLGTTPTLQRNPLFRGSRQPFTRDPGSYALSAPMREMLRYQIGSRNHDQPEKDANTIGCPVRFATFPQLGLLARQYAREQGLSDEALMFPGESAIFSGCNFVAGCLESIAEARQIAGQEVRRHE